MSRPLRASRADSIDLSRIADHARVLVAVVSLAVASLAYVGLSASVAPAPSLDTPRLLLAGCIGVVVYLFWSLSLSIAVSYDGTVGARLRAVAATFLLLSAAGTAWPVATGVSGSAAVRSAMEARVQTTRHELSEAYATGTSAGPLKSSLSALAGDPALTPRARTSIERLSAWIERGRADAADAYRTGTVALGEMADVASGDLDRARFALAAGRVETSLSKLRGLFPTPILRQIATELAHAGREKRDRSLSDVAAGLGQLATEAETSAGFERERSDPMNSVLRDPAGHAYAWLVALGLVLAPAMTTWGLSTLRSMAQTEGLSREWFTSGRSAPQRDASWAPFGVAVVGLCLISSVTVRETFQQMAPVRDIPDIPGPATATPSVGPEPSIVRYEPGDGSGGSGPFLPSGPIDPDAMAGPMSFSLSADGSILAVGKIRDTTPAEFERFAREAASSARSIQINSPGGSVEGAIALSKMIRNGGLATRVPANGYCASACPIVLAGGIARSAGTGARIGVHQVYAPSAGKDATSVDLAKSISDVQATIARIQSLLGDLGVDPELWTLAMTTGPDELRILSPEEMDRLRVARPDESTPLVGLESKITPQVLQ